MEYGDTRVLYVHSIFQLQEKERGGSNKQNEKDKELLMEQIEGIELTNLERELNEYVRIFKQKYKENLEDSGRKASGNLLGSIVLNIVSFGTTLKVQLNVADYYWYVENGRNGGKFPPMDKIMQWIDDKGIEPYPSSNGVLPTQRQLAFLIGRKIAREGFKGSYDLSSTMDEINAIFKERFEVALQQDFNIYTQSILDDVLKNLM